MGNAGMVGVEPQMKGKGGNKASPRGKAKSYKKKGAKGSGMGYK